MITIDPSRALGAYAAVASLALAWLTLGAAIQPSPHVATLDVERINVREPDGTLRMIITDSAHQPGIVLGKQVLPHPGRPDAGIIFYNREGIENGGLIFDGGRSGDHPTNGGSLTFDRYRQDQTLQLVSTEDGTSRYAGLRVIDRPDQPMNFAAAVRAARMPDGATRTAALAAAHAVGAQRAFLGRDEDGAAMLQLRDGTGRPRIRMRVEADGTARIEVLDAEGKVARSL